MRVLVALAMLILISCKPAPQTQESTTTDAVPATNVAAASDVADAAETHVQSDLKAAAWV